MSGIEAAGLALGMISAIISIIDATNQVYEAVKDEAGLPTNFKKSATKLPLISKLLEDAERYVKAADEATETAFTPTLEDCKAQATKLQELFERVMPEEGESRWDRYVKAARTIGKGGRVENLVGGILDDLQLLATRFPEVTTPRTKEQLAKAVEEVTKMEPSLPDGFEQMPAYAHYGSGAQNNNTGSGIQHINSGTGHQNSGSGQQYIGTNHIVHNYASRTIDSAASYGNVYFKVPRTMNRLFTGRAELLFRIQAIILRSDTTASHSQQRRFVITGLGGQGKSEMCLQVANLMKDEYILFKALFIKISADGHSFWGIFWVDVDKPSTAERDFTAVAKLLGHVTETVPEALQVLATTHQSWLLILDNADDPDFDYQVYLPPGTHGVVLMTSRVAECRQYSPDAFEALEGLEKDDSKKLLLKAAELSPDLWPSHDNQAREVVRLLGSHTLALIQAGAYISQGHCQLHQYTEVYKRQRQRLLKYRPKQAQSRYRDVYATFEASADILEQSRSESAEDALRLLEILSMLDSGVLAFQVFEEAWKSCKETLRASSVKAREEDEWDPFRLTEASSLLISLSLVTRHDLDGSMGLSMHPLTHAWAKDRQDSERQGVAWIAAGCVLGFSRLNTHMWQTQERRLLPHVLSYLDIKVNKAFGLASKAVITPIVLKCGSALLDMRQDSKLGQLIQDTFLKLGQNPDEPSEEFLPLYDLQAKSLMDLGMNKEAVALLEQVVQIRETTLPETHPDRLASQHVLARAYQANGQVVEAVALLEQVVKIRETTLAETHPDRLESQHELATAYQANGQVVQAVALLEQVVQIEETTLAETHPDRLASQHELARAYQANRQVVEAVALLEQVVQIRETTLPETHPDRLASQHVLATAYQANGQVDEAITLLEQVVQIRETTLPETHPDRLNSQHSLAMAYKANGQVDEAITLLEQVVQIQETTLPETHPDRLNSQHNLAMTYKANGQVDEAITLLEQVVQIQETTLPETHPDRLNSQHNLAMTYQANGQVDEAITLLKQVVKIERLKCPIGHHSRVASENALSYFLQLL
ncbi:TPR-like protein [Cadophora sp. DSE1049]|nr:TPR-like protein [Cadophora sp. DSE1049]